MLLRGRFLKRWDPKLQFPYRIDIDGPTVPGFFYLSFKFIPMKKMLAVVLMITISSCTKPTSEKEDVLAIRAILEQQQKAWSNHDLEGFMQGYWKSDSLTYFSRGKITQGWQTTLANYKKGYPSPAETGELNFKIANITKIDADAYWVMGEYFLSREVGDANGTFMIIFKRIDGAWKIVGDSSC
jgi:hypothetical protein